MTIVPATAPNAPASATLDLLDLFAQTTAAISGLATPQGAIDLSLRQICELIGAEVGHGYQIAFGSALEYSETWFGPQHRIAEIARSFNAINYRVGAGVATMAISTGQVQSVPDLGALPPSEQRTALLAAGFTSLVALPLRVAARTVGVIELFGTTMRPIDDDMFAGLTAFSHTLGAVVESIDARRAQTESAVRANLVLDNAGDAFVAIDGDGIVLAWNREAERMYGYSAGEAIGSLMSSLIMPPEYRADHDAGIERFKHLGHRRMARRYVELEALRKSGERFPVEMAFWGIQGGSGWEFFSFARDITQRKAREAELRYRAEHDEVTRVANRTVAVRRLDELLAGDIGRGLAVIAIALERFKIIRARVGIVMADRLLTVLADRLRGMVRESETVARLSDDEFVLICPDISGERAVLLSERVRAAVSGLVDVDEDRIVVPAAVGLVMADPTIDTATGVLRDLSMAMSLRRQETAGQVTVLGSVGRDRVRHRLDVERELARGIDSGQLRLHYQPVVEVASGRLVGVEALVRWQHPVRGLLAPAEFIDVAEETGLILPLGSWVLDEACRQGAAWQTAGVEGVSISVNLSARQFGQSDLADRISDQVRAGELDLTRIPLVLEVTESLLMDDPRTAVGTLTRMRELGFGLAIDDFGTGYSSLAYLKSFPVDTVKIDRSFVTAIDTDPGDRAIVAAVTELGHALGLTVLAEGAEEEGQVAQLRRMGVDKIQGYYFGRPMPADVMTQQLLGSGG